MTISITSRSSLPKLTPPPASEMKRLPANVPLIPPDKNVTISEAAKHAALVAQHVAAYGRQPVAGELTFVDIQSIPPADREVYLDSVKSIPIEMRETRPVLGRNGKSITTSFNEYVSWLEDAMRKDKA